MLTVPVVLYGHQITITMYYDKNQSTPVRFEKALFSFMPIQDFKRPTFGHR